MRFRSAAYRKTLADFDQTPGLVRRISRGVFLIPLAVVSQLFAGRRGLQPPGEFVGDYDYSRSANPTRAALETALGELEGGMAVAFSSGLAAEHALITVVCAAGGSRVGVPPSFPLAHVSPSPLR